MPYTEDSMVNTILDVTDNSLSLYKSAEKHGIPILTLLTRIHGTLAKEEIVIANRRLS